jgi:hypothetical protein
MICLVYTRIWLHIISTIIIAIIAFVRRSHQHSDWKHVTVDCLSDMNNELITCIAERGCRRRQRAHLVDQNTDVCFAQNLQKING